MAVATYVGGRVTDTGSLDWPTGYQAGDVGCLISESNVSPTGFTLQGGGDASGEAYLHTRVATASEAAVSVSGPAILVVFRGANQADPVEAVGEFQFTAIYTLNGDTSVNLGTLTTLGADRLYVTAGNTPRANGSVSVAFSAGLTELVDGIGAGSSAHLFAASEAITTAATTPQRTAAFRDQSTSATNSVAATSVVFAVKPANTAPNAPTNLSPSGRTLDRSATNRFSWDFSDPDAGDSQSQYDLRYRLTSSTTWTTVTGTTPNQYRDFAGGTFAAGDYEWQVRTYDAQGLVGPYSSSAFFTAADAPAGPSITDPVAGQTISTEIYTVQWSTPSQEAYQVRTVTDAAGSPDATTVYTDTGEVTSTTARSRTVDFAVNGRKEHVQVRVKDGGLWSSWISVNVTVSYTAPATPTVAVDVTSVVGAIAVQASHPTPSGSQPTVTHIDVWRRVSAEGGDGIRIRKDLAPTAVAIDYAVDSEVDFGYRIRAYGDNGTSSWSAWSEAATEVAVYYGGSYA